MEIQSKEDYLTKIANYREFDKQLSIYIHQFKKRSRHFSLALIDLDGFKKINDNYGYEAGDSVIMECAELIRSNIRVGDQVFRYKHGDEFAVMFPGVLAKGARKASERIKETIKQHRFQLPQQSVNLTASIGLVSIDQEELKKKELKQTLEKALREAKKKGDSIFISE